MGPSKSFYTNAGSGTRRSEYDDIRDFIQEGPAKNYNEILKKLQKNARHKFSKPRYSKE